MIVHLSIMFSTECENRSLENNYNSNYFFFFLEERNIVYASIIDKNKKNCFFDLAVFCSVPRESIQVEFDFDHFSINACELMVLRENKNTYIF